jgi:hypothetical protein
MRQGAMASAARISPDTLQRNHLNSKNPKKSREITAIGIITTERTYMPGRYYNEKKVKKLTD